MGEDERGDVGRERGKSDGGRRGRRDRVGWEKGRVIRGRSGRKRDLGSSISGRSCRSSG